MRKVGFFKDDFTDKYQSTFKEHILFSEKKRTAKVLRMKQKM